MRVGVKQRKKRGKEKRATDIQSIFEFSIVLSSSARSVRTPDHGPVTICATQNYMYLFIPPFLPFSPSLFSYTHSHSLYLSLFLHVSCTHTPLPLLTYSSVVSATAGLIERHTIDNAHNTRYSRLGYQTCHRENSREISKKKSLHRLGVQSEQRTKKRERRNETKTHLTVHNRFHLT